MHSILRRAYYGVKPFIPRRAQITLRRFVARKIREKTGSIWPIDEATATPPPGWKGWPDGKQFAFVITHDVDYLRGQGRCLDLMRVEKEFGFVASYNFVPERYPDDPALRDNLVSNGFEVGVHGLKHDGKYYSSHRFFQKRAVKINEYLSNWNCVGFRSPSMLHNLQWIRELKIEYDSSTFDTDPFEPQPDGVGTIFPFLVSGTTGKDGYIEIPYTLPQDFTLFILLREKTIDIWKRKLDWIASQGGLALLLVHPDYINVTNRPSENEEYPIAYYREMLEYVATRYRGSYYHALPKEIASYCRENLQ